MEKRIKEIHFYKDGQKVAILDVFNDTKIDELAAILKIQIMQGREWTYKEV